MGSSPRPPPGQPKSSGRTQSSGCRSGGWRQPVSPRPSLSAPSGCGADPPNPFPARVLRGRRWGARRCLREGPVGASPGRGDPPLRPVPAAHRGVGMGTRVRTAAIWVSRFPLLVRSCPEADGPAARVSGRWQCPNPTTGLLPDCQVPYNREVEKVLVSGKLR